MHRFFALGSFIEHPGHGENILRTNYSCGNRIIQGQNYHVLGMDGCVKDDVIASLCVVSDTVILDYFIVLYYNKWLRALFDLHSKRRTTQ